jgi:hypothetical protein
MKAVIMAAPAADGSTTSVADIDEPRPGPGQVAIDVAYAGVNFIDVMARRGDPGYASAWPYDLRFRDRCRVRPRHAIHRNRHAPRSRLVCSRRDIRRYTARYVARAAQSRTTMCCGPASASPKLRPVR